MIDRYACGLTPNRPSIAPLALPDEGGGGGDRAMILGCGYVGQAVARRWRDEGVTVTATTTTPDRLPALQGLSDRALVLRADNPEAVVVAIHDADSETLLVSIGASGRDRYEQDYLGSAQTLAAALPRCPQVRQVIYTSSYAVYGDRGGAWITEADAPQPANRNGEILIAAEQALLDLATDQRAVCVLRLGGICGPGREVVKIFRGAAGTVRSGTGQDWSNWIHLDDIVGAIAFARHHRLNGVYNLVHDVPLTRQDLLDRTFAKHGLDPVTWDGSPAGDRPYNARVSNQKIKDAGYSFVYRDIPL